MEAGAHRSHLWFHTHLPIFVSDCGCDDRVGSEEAPGMMATSGITTIEEYVEFLLSLEKTEKIVKELGILNYREKNMYVKSNKYFVLFAIKMFTFRYLLYSSNLYF